jgi:peptide/nickel transport system substrate-binding protein
MQRRADRSDKHWRGTAILAVAALMIAVVAIGCGGGDSGGDSKQSGSPAKGKRGDTLTVAVAFGPPTLNPAFVGASAQWAWPVGLAYEPLVIFTPKGGFAPGLAEKFGFQGSGNKKFTVTLRENLKFADDTPLTSAEAVASLRYVLKQPGNTQKWASQVKSVEADGPLGVTMMCDPGCPDLPYVLSQNAQLGEIISPAGLKAPKQLATKTFGAGPYVLDEAKSVSNDHYTYNANPKYWNQDGIHYNHVVIRIVADANARLSSLKSGQVDLIDVPAANASTIASDNSLTLMRTGGAAFQGFVINDREGTVAPELKDARVRQALNYAIDRKAIAKGLGYAEGSAQMTGPGSGAWDDSLESVYPYDPAKAKDLLAEAGHPNGFELTVETHEQGDLAKYSQAAVSYWEKIGVKTDLKTDTVIANWLDAMAKKKYAVSGYAYGTLPFSIQSIDFYSDSGGPFNGYTTDPKVTALLEDARSAAPDKREQIYQEVNKYSVDQGFGVPLAVVEQLWGYSKDISVPEASSANSIPVLNQVSPAN